jgi:hypothetical protein
MEYWFVASKFAVESRCDPVAAAKHLPAGLCVPRFIQNINGRAVELKEQDEAHQREEEIYLGI